MSRNLCAVSPALKNRMRWLWFGVLSKCSNDWCHCYFRVGHVTKWAVSREITSWGRGSQQIHPEKHDVKARIMMCFLILMCVRPIRDRPDPGDRRQRYCELSRTRRSQLHHCRHACAGGLEVQAGETSGTSMCESEFVLKPEKIKSVWWIFTAGGLHVKTHT